jgi:hypothetical protein
MDIRDKEVHVDVVLPGELHDEDPKPRYPQPKNEELEEYFRKSIEKWLK